MRKTKLMLLTGLSILLITSCKKTENHFNSEARMNNEGKKRIMVDEVTDASLAEGNYKFVTWNTWNSGSNLSLHAVGGYNAAENAAVEQAAFVTNNTGHEWHPIPVAGSPGVYTIWLMNNSGYRVLTVLGSGTPATGNAVGVRAVNASLAARQQWKIEYIGLGTYKLKLSSNTSLAVNITPAGSTTAGAVFKLGATTDLNSSFLVYRMAVKDLTVTNWFKYTTGINAMDGAYSLPLGNGKVLWNFGDTYYNQYSAGTIDCGFYINNSIIIQPDANNWNQAQSVTKIGPAAGGHPNSSVYVDGTSSGIWPTTGFVGLNDTLYVYSRRGHGMTATPPDKLAKIKISSIPATGTTLTVAGYDNLQDFGPYAFLTSFSKESDGYVYAYGFRRQQCWACFDANMYLARFPVSNPRAAWNFYKGTVGGSVSSASNWTTDTAQMQIIGTGKLLNTVAKVNNKYVLISTDFGEGCSQSPRHIYTAISSGGLTGPFNTPKKVYTIDDLKNGVYPKYYGAKAHPQVSVTANGLLITYNINGYSNGNPPVAPCFTNCDNGRMDPEIYRPRGIRVPLKLIDPSL